MLHFARCCVILCSFVYYVSFIYFGVVTNGQALSSLLSEFSQHFNQLYAQSLIAVNSPHLLSSSLQVTLFEATLSLLRFVVSHVEQVLTGQADKSTQAIGQVWSANDTMQKIPLSNKVAVRRVIMEKISSVKDSTQEFQRIIDLGCTSSEEGVAAAAGDDEGGAGGDSNGGDGGSDGDEDDFDDDMDEEDQYSAIEMPTALRAVSLMSTAHANFKTILQTLTQVGSRAGL